MLIWWMFSMTRIITSWLWVKSTQPDIWLTSRLDANLNPAFVCLVSGSSENIVTSFFSVLPKTTPGWWNMQTPYTGASSSKGLPLDGMFTFTAWWLGLTVFTADAYSVDCRMCTIMKRQGQSLSYLEQVRQHLSRLPSIDPNTRTLLITGFPNVGKSSFINKVGPALGALKFLSSFQFLIDTVFTPQVTRADVEVQPYAFTTKSLFVGHMDYRYLRWQVRHMNLSSWAVSHWNQFPLHDISATGGGHSWNFGSLSGGAQHHWDAGHHCIGSSPLGCPLHHGCLRAMWPQLAPASKNGVFVLKKILGLECVALSVWNLLPCEFSGLNWKEFEVFDLRSLQCWIPIGFKWSIQYQIFFFTDAVHLRVTMCKIRQCSQIQLIFHSFLGFLSKFLSLIWLTFSGRTLQQHQTLVCQQTSSGGG